MDGGCTGALEGAGRLVDLIALGLLRLLERAGETGLRDNINFA